MTVVLSILAATALGRTVEGPWVEGAYVSLAVRDHTVYAIWVDGEALKASSSTDAGQTWANTVTLARGVEAGDGGSVWPQIALLGDGTPVVAYAIDSHPYLARRDAGKWAATKLGSAETRGSILDLGVTDAGPFVVWIDTRRTAPGHYLTDVYAWVGGHEEPVYVDANDGVCSCCLPAAGAMGGKPAVAFRDADGPVREIRLATLIAGGWKDLGLVTSGGWAPGGCPADGPVFDGERVLVSDARGGHRRIWAGDVAISEPNGAEALQPRVIVGREGDERVLWIEAREGSAQVQMGGKSLFEIAGRLELGEPVRVGDEIWIPWQGSTAMVTAVAW